MILDEKINAYIKIIGPYPSYGMESDFVNGYSKC